MSAGSLHFLLQITIRISYKRNGAFEATAAASIWRHWRKQNKSHWYIQEAAVFHTQM
jgi:hypothetical protein